MKFFVVQYQGMYGTLLPADVHVIKISNDNESQKGINKALKDIISKDIFDGLIDVFEVEDPMGYNDFIENLTKHFKSYTRCEIGDIVDILDIEDFDMDVLSQDIPLCIDIFEL